MKSLRFNAFLIGVLALPGPLNLQPIAGSQATALGIEEQVVAEMNPAVDLRHLFTFGKQSFASPGGARLAWLEKSGKRFRLSLDGQPAGEYGQVLDVRFSPDDKRVIVHARREKQELLAIDGNEITGPVKAFALPTFTPGGQVAYAEHTDKWRLKIDGKEQFAFEDTPCAIEFDPTGEAIAIAVVRKRRLFWIVNNQEQPGFDILGRLAFSSDGRRFAYAGSNDAVGFLKNRGKGFIVVDGKQSAEYQGDVYSTLLSDFATQSIITLQGGLKSFRPDIHGVGDPVFSPDGKRLGYAVNQGKNSVVVTIDGQPGPAFESVIAGPFFSADGEHFAYLATKGKKLLEIRDHKVVREVELHDTNFFGDVAVTPDLSRLGVVLGKGGAQFFKGVTPHARRRVLVDGIEQEENDCFGIFALQFSPNGRHLAYFVQGAHVVLDGKAVRPQEMIIPESLAFTDDHTLRYITRDGHKFIRVTVKLE